MNLKNFYLLALMIFLSACATKNVEKEDSDLNYMQNIEQLATEASLNTNLSTLQPGDQLVILVSGRDLDVVKPFNQNYSSGEVIQNSVANSNVVTSAQTTIAGPTYIVDSNGIIDFPILGKLNTTGKTIEEFTSELRGKLTRYLISPVVAMRLANYKITVLGEVNKPGQYVIADGQTTLLNALGLAGDLTLYGKRNDILVVRNQDGVISKQRIDLTDSSFLSSPYYFLKQGDVIYVSANKNRELAAKQNPNTGLYISVASVAIGVIGIIVSVLKK